MDVLGAIFLVVLILIVLATNIIFIKKINKTSSSHYKYKILFFLISVASIFTIMILAVVFQNIILIDYFNLTMNIDGYPYRIILMIAMVTSNIAVNFTLVKLYLKRRETKSKNKINELELIGKE